MASVRTEKLGYIIASNSDYYGRHSVNAYTLQACSFQIRQICINFFPMAISSPVYQTKRKKEKEQQQQKKTTYLVRILSNHMWIVNIVNTILITENILAAVKSFDVS